MDNVKHTPGPWRWWTSNSWRRLRAESGRGHTVSVLEPFVSSDGHPNCTVSDPDMDLIAAAPEMLAEVEHCAANLEEAANILRANGQPIVASIFDRASQRAKATAAKATGATP